MASKIITSRRWQDNDFAPVRLKPRTPWAEIRFLLSFYGEGVWDNVTVQPAHTLYPNVPGVHPSHLWRYLHE